MPKQNNNIVMRSTRGMFGKQVVFKERDGESYVSAPPRSRKDRVRDAEQQAREEKFSKSVAYASYAMKNAEIKEAYAAKAKRRQTAYNVAFNDAYFAPEVQGMITSAYRGEAGQPIIVQARDNFRVNAVKVAIYNSANELIETGDATANTDELNWTYTATQANANVTGTKITATAIDLPGNEGSLEITL